MNNIQELIQQKVNLEKEIAFLKGRKRIEDREAIAKGISVSPKYKAYNLRVKTFKNGEQEYTFHQSPVLLNIESKDKGISIQAQKIIDQINNGKVEEPKYKDSETKKQSRSIQRAKTKIKDISKSNKWEYFITWTIDKKKSDRYDYNIVSKKVKSQIDRIRKYNPYVKYIVIPEQHKDGAWHFHGLISGIEKENLTRCVNSKTKKPTMKEAYNLKQYKLGYSSLEPIRNNDKAVNYLLKYISKDLIKSIKGKKMYWYSKTLELPQEEYILNTKGNNESLQETLLKQAKHTHKGKRKELDGHLIQQTTYITI